MLVSVPILLLSVNLESLLWVVHGCLSLGGYKET